MPINLFADDFLWVGELCLVERSGYCDLLRLPLTPDSPTHGPTRPFFYGEVSLQPEVHFTHTQGEAVKVK
jgi:hypothetical protein